MRISHRGIVAIIATIASASIGIAHSNDRRAQTTPRRELKSVGGVTPSAPPADPQLLFLLMGQFANANLHGEGAEFFAERLREFSPRLSDPQKALYLAAIGVP